VDRAFGIYLPEQVQAGYMYLMEYYNDGDKICIFGSSGIHSSYWELADLEEFHWV